MIMLSLKAKRNKRKEKKTINKKSKTNKQKAAKQTKTATTYSSICLYHRWRCYQAIALIDQQGGPTSLAPLSPS